MYILYAIITLCIEGFILTPLLFGELGFMLVFSPKSLEEELKYSAIQAHIIYWTLGIINPIGLIYKTLIYFFLEDE